MKVAITGASGFVGTALQKHFSSSVVIDRDDSHDVIVEKLKQVDIVINLAGAPIIKRWSKSYKKTLYNSRIYTTQKLVRAINKSDVKHFISASAIGIYPNHIPCDETSVSPSADFLQTLVQAWEQEALRCSKLTTLLRFGVILGVEGGALKTMLTPFQLGLGGTLGKGEMMMSWISLEDLLASIDFIVEHALVGVINATTPYPITNYIFTKTLANILHRPSFIPVPTFILKLLFGDGSSILLDSKEVYPNTLIKKGFSFKYPTIVSALSSILSTQKNNL